MIENVKKILFGKNELDDNKLCQTLNGLLSRAIDYADIYFQQSYSESWILENGIVKDSNYNIERGFGMRTNKGEQTSFAYSDDITLSALIKTADTVKSIARSGKKRRVFVPSPVAGSELYNSQNPLDSFNQAEKIKLLHRIDEEARRQDSRISEVTAGLSALFETIFIMASDGTVAADIRPLVRLSVSVVAEDKNKREEGYCGGGGRIGYDFFLKGDLCDYYAKEAVRQALVNLNASEVPAGNMPVVLGPGWPAVLLHEAVGHGLEGDFNRKGASAFTGKIGERVASPLCTIVDNGSLPKTRGSLSVDDEGAPTQCTVLIENGILKNYMLDKLNARLLKMQPTGNGRRESYASLPIPRMTNTYMQAGKHDPQEIIASVKKGLYAVNFSGGQVDITSGKFVFSTSEAYMIENGKITYPVKDASLIGNGPDVLTKVSMVGNDLQLDRGVGTCGKDGQSVPTCVGQPTLKVDNLTVGGTK